MIVFSCLLCMTLIYVMIGNLWLIMATHCLFLNCNSSYNICPYVKCIKIGCLLISKEKQNRKCENVVAK